MTRIVSLFSGIGGLDLACERAFHGHTITQVEREPFAVRVLERRWPDARRHDDVTTCRGEDCDVIAGGFPCTDLSVAGKREGLDAARSGLYHEMMRIVSEASPRYVVVENAPPLLRYRGRVDTDFARLGYGTIWQVCEASDVGAPHRRQRVFIVAVRGLAGSQLLPRSSPQGDLFAPAFGDARAGALWPTPTVCGNDNRRGASQKSGDGLATAAKAWPTPTAHDWKDSGHEPAAQARNSPCVPASAVMDADQAPGVLNPAWVELLMGLPPGWTAQTPTKNLPPHFWPAGRGESQLPGEPPRLVQRKSVANRGARLKALGNAVVWQQAEAAIRRALEVAR